MSIQSKLLLMLLLTSILSAAVVGAIGYQSGRSSLRASVFDRLTEIRESQSRQLETQFSDLKNSLAIYSRGNTAAEAIAAFTAGFAELDAATINIGQAASLRRYYDRMFADMTLDDGGNRVDVRALLPKSNPQRYLQALYSAPFENWERAIEFDDARDGSRWSAANARFNEFFREIVHRFEFEDLLLLDTDGNVVYSAYKGPDLGTNILTGPYREGQLTEAYEKALASNSIDYVGVTDFGWYLPAEEPTAWFLSPVGSQDQIAGVMAVQFPISRINDLMTAKGQWRDTGMGKTGETILVGPDDLMRSDSRLFRENREAFVSDVVDGGTPPEIAEESIDRRGTTLVQPVNTESVEVAQRGNTGALIEDDYLGHQALQSYSPVDLPGLHWVIVAKIDTDEAFAPVSQFTRTLVLSTVLIIFAVCLAAMLLARLFVRPIRRLQTGAQQIGAGDYEVNIPVWSRDEFGDLTTTFNDMSQNLAIKEKLLEEQRAENERLMLSLMPEPVMRRYLDGEETIAQDHNNVTVLFADVLGLDDLSHRLTSEELLVVINSLTRQFDAAAESLGVEHVRTLHDGYVAACGLNTPRLDNVRRTVDFAIEMDRIVDRYAAESGYDLRLRAGIDNGAVSSGLVGRSTLTYDVWGATVDLAFRVQRGNPQAGIYVTARVYDVMHDTLEFVAAGESAGEHGTEPVWRLRGHPQ
ncbi:adenylate/guanylate cyclase domain-containing protein [Mycolicibacterium parafortuitum]|nr:adenylate/guanylate cyclase domain-containing protein [Mycolicibacterium parafortuitum]ORB29851.1 adenylate/guanylate cyclase domain-containing protein [Mycolicibacterium parafortuitum]